MDWDDHIAAVRAASYGTRRTVAKDAAGPLPDTFRPARVRGRRPAYQEDRPRGPVRAIDAGSRYVLRRDRYHPDRAPVRHAVLDATAGELLATAFRVLKGLLRR